MDDDERGAIIDDEAPMPAAPDDNTGAAPVNPTSGPITESDTSDAASNAEKPAPAPGQGPAAPTPTNFPGLAQPQGPMAGVGKKIISYLMSADAAPPQSIEQAGRAVDPEGKMSPADRNVLALDRVRDTAGDNAAWQLMQTHRGAYNATTSFAQAALTGTPQKPADLDAAIKAANQAQEHVLDGSNITFAKHAGAITATVTPPGSNQPQSIMLTPQQFGQFLQVGGDGQWDKVMDQSAPATLQRLAGTQQPNAPAPAQGAQNNMAPVRGPGPRDLAGPKEDAGAPASKVKQPPAAPAAPAAPDSAAVRTGKPQAMDVTEGDQAAIPGTHDEHGHSLAPADKDPNGYGEQLERRSRTIFPSVNQEQQRQEWMAAQEQQGVKNEIDQKRAGHEWMVDSARIKAAGGVEAARLKAEQQREHGLAVAKRWEQQHDDRVMAERGRMAGRELNGPNWLLMSPPQRDAILRKYGLPTDSDPPPAPTQNEQPKAGGGLHVQVDANAGKKLYNGKWYTREEYQTAFGK